MNRKGLLIADNREVESRIGQAFFIHRHITFSPLVTMLKRQVYEKTVERMGLFIVQSKGMLIGIAVGDDPRG